MSSCCGFRDDFIVCSGYVGNYFDGVGNVGCGGFADSLKHFMHTLVKESR